MQDVVQPIHWRHVIYMHNVSFCLGWIGVIRSGTEDSAECRTIAGMGAVQACAITAQWKGLDKLV